MKIIIVGIGKVGYAIAEQMTGENHDLVVIDRNSAVLDHVDSMLDVMCVEGNGASASVLLEAGVREADLLIAVSENDEVNLICCLMAKKLGAKHTVARVRNPEYFRDAPILRREIGLDMIINPENAAAQEISRILRVPSAFSVETFARGLVELIGFQTEESDSLVGKSLIDYNRENPNSILMCAAKRGEEVIVPNGSFVPPKKSVNRAETVSSMWGRSGCRARNTRSSAVSGPQVRRISSSSTASSASSEAWAVMASISLPLPFSAAIWASSGASCSKISLIIRVFLLHGAARPGSGYPAAGCGAPPDPQSRAPSGTRCAGIRQAAFRQWSAQ